MSSTASSAASKLPVILAAGAIGNILEWFDFAVYGFFCRFH